MLTTSQNNFDVVSLFESGTRLPPSDVNYVRTSLADDHTLAHRELTNKLSATAVTRDAPMRAVTLSLFLEGWPSNDQRTRIVLIGENLRAT